MINADCMISAKRGRGLHDHREGEERDGMITGEGRTGGGFGGAAARAVTSLLGFDADGADAEALRTSMKE
jgi:hypothetical protein